MTQTATTLKVPTQNVSQFSSDPVFKEGLFWYFWDETQAHRHGPYRNELQARLHLTQYCKEELS